MKRDHVQRTSNRSIDTNTTGETQESSSVIRAHGCSQTDQSRCQYTRPCSVVIQRLSEGALRKLIHRGCTKTKKLSGEGSDVGGAQQVDPKAGETRTNRNGGRKKESMARLSKEKCLNRNGQDKHISHHKGLRSSIVERDGEGSGRSEELSDIINFLIQTDPNGRKEDYVMGIEGSTSAWPEPTPDVYAFAYEPKVTLLKKGENNKPSYDTPRDGHKSEDDSYLDASSVKDNAQNAVLSSLESPDARLFESEHTQSLESVVSSSDSKGRLVIDEGNDVTADNALLAEAYRPERLSAGEDGDTLSHRENVGPTSVSDGPDRESVKSFGVAGCLIRDVNGDVDSSSGKFEKDVHCTQPTQEDPPRSTLEKMGDQLQDTGELVWMPYISHTTSIPNSVEPCCETSSVTRTMEDTHVREGTGVRQEEGTRSRKIENLSEMHACRHKSESYSRKKRRQPDRLCRSHSADTATLSGRSKGLSVFATVRDGRITSVDCKSYRKRRRQSLSKERAPSKPTPRADSREQEDVDVYFTVSEVVQDMINTTATISGDIGKEGEVKSLKHLFKAFCDSNSYRYEDFMTDGIEQTASRVLTHDICEPHNSRKRQPHPLYSRSPCLADGRTRPKRRRKDASPRGKRRLTRSQWKKSENAVSHTRHSRGRRVALSKFEVRTTKTSHPDVGVPEFYSSNTESSVDLSNAIASLEIDTASTKHSCLLTPAEQGGSENVAFGRPTSDEQSCEVASSLPSQEERGRNDDIHPEPVSVPPRAESVESDNDDDRLVICDGEPVVETSIFRCEVAVSDNPAVTDNVNPCNDMDTPSVDCIPNMSCVAAPRECSTVEKTSVVIDIPAKQSHHGRTGEGSDGEMSMDNKMLFGILDTDVDTKTAGTQAWDSPQSECGDKEGDVMDFQGTGVLEERADAVDDRCSSTPPKVIESRAPVDEDPRAMDAQCLAESITEYDVGYRTENSEDIAVNAAQDVQYKRRRMDVVLEGMKGMEDNQRGDTTGVDHGQGMDLERPAERDGTTAREDAHEEHFTKFTSTHESDVQSVAHNVTEDIQEEDESWTDCEFQEVPDSVPKQGKDPSGSIAAARMCVKPEEGALPGDEIVVESTPIVSMEDDGSQECESNERAGSVENEGDSGLQTVRPTEIYPREFQTSPTVNGFANVKEEPTSDQSTDLRQVIDATAETPLNLSLRETHVLKPRPDVPVGTVHPQVAAIEDGRAPVSVFSTDDDTLINHSCSTRLKALRPTHVLDWSHHRPEDLVPEGTEKVNSESILQRLLLDHTKDDKAADSADPLPVIIDVRSLRPEFEAVQSLHPKKPSASGAAVSASTAGVERGEQTTTAPGKQHLKASASVSPMSFPEHFMSTLESKILELKRQIHHLTILATYKEKELGCIRNLRLAKEEALKQLECKYPAIFLPHNVNRRDAAPVTSDFPTEVVHAIRKPAVASRSTEFGRHRRDAHQHTALQGAFPSNASNNRTVIGQGTPSFRKIAPKQSSHTVEERAKHVIPLAGPFWLPDNPARTSTSPKRHNQDFTGSHPGHHLATLLPWGRQQLSAEQGALISVLPASAVLLDSGAERSYSARSASPLFGLKAFVEKPRSVVSDNEYSAHRSGDAHRRDASVNACASSDTYADQAHSASPHRTTAHESFPLQTLHMYTQILQANRGKDPYDVAATLLQEKQEGHPSIQSHAFYSAMDAWMKLSQGVPDSFTGSSASFQRSSAEFSDKNEELADNEARSAVRRLRASVCVNCGDPGVKYVCSCCRTQTFCSVECQMELWKKLQERSMI